MPSVSIVLLAGRTRRRFGDGLEGVRIGAVNDDGDAGIGAQRINDRRHAEEQEQRQVGRQHGNDEPAILLALCRKARNRPGLLRQE
ncbi:hypothetical protein [Nitratireductor sp. XY-223]|uniref:hypothetical protein n=1 Tax=Nitratireductor sp. XY-223 TaxID=2561926 RepID=UPI0010A9E265|nr:hypothetical protein [Nitratireductor sp. XY-223]